MTYLQLFTVEYTSFSYNIVTLLIHLSNGIQNSYKLYLINFLVRFFMTISGSQASAHAVCVNSDRRTGTRIGISKPVHGKDPEGVGVGGEVGKDVGVAESVSACGPRVLVGVLLLQLVVLDSATTVGLGRLPEESRITVFNRNLHRCLGCCWPVQYFDSARGRVFARLVPRDNGICACLSCGDSVEDQLGVGVSLHHLNRFVIETLNWHFVLSLSLVPSDLGAGSPWMPTSSFTLSFASAVTSVMFRASTKGIRSVSFATFGREAWLASDLPALFTAMTLNWYSWPLVSFCNTTLFSLQSKVSQICQLPTLGLLASMMYPVMAVPPSSMGSSQFSVMLLSFHSETVGWPGGRDTVYFSLANIGLLVFRASDSPISLTANTLNSYSLPTSRSLTLRYVLPVTPCLAQASALTMYFSTR